MCKRVILLASFVVVLCLVGKAPAIEYNWIGGGDNSWCDDSHWSPSGVPGPEDTAIMDGTPAQGPIIGVGCDVNVGNIQGPCKDMDGAGPQQVDITGGSLIIRSDWQFDGDKGAKGPATVNISGNSIVKVLGGWIRGLDASGMDPCAVTIINISGSPDIYVQSEIRAADNDGSYFEFNMSGGDVNCGGLFAGNDGGGRFTITGGTLICRGQLAIENREGTSAEFTLDGGAYVEVSDGFGFPMNENGTGEVYLNNGTLICGSFTSEADAMWHMYIGNVIMKIVADETEKMQGFVDDGRITGLDGSSKPEVVWDPPYTLVGFGIVQEKAYSPSPQTGTGGLCPNSVTISWTPGVYCVDDHNVYFGTSEDDVNESATPYLEHYASNSVTLTNLEVGQSYFWRVDEVSDSCEASPWKGSVWQFSTEPGAASDPSPANNRRGLKAEDVDTLSWSTHCIADAHNVYFGADLPASIVLFDDDFESGAFEPNWTADPNWEIFDANGDPNFDGRDANMAKATGVGDLITVNVDATEGDPCAMNISFYFRKTEEVNEGDIKLYYYDGGNWDYIADLNSLPGANDVWIHYSDTVTDSQYFVSTFKIKLEANITSGGTVYIDDVSITNTWPTAAKWYQDQVAGTSYPISVEPMTVYYWRVDTVIDGNVYQGPHWMFSTGYGGLLMYYPFDGTQGNDLPSPITDDTGNVTFTKYLDPIDPCCWVKYGESNSITYSTASADFEPNAGLYRLDPCGPSELTRDILRLDGYQYTVEMWVMPRNLTDEENVYVISKRGSWGVEIHTDNDWEFRWQGGGGDSGSDSVENDTWYHVAVVSDQTDEDLSGFYLNGDRQGDAGGPLPPDNNSPIWIGCRVLADGNLGNFFDGMIDEIRVHDIALRPCAFLLGTFEPEYPKCPTPEDAEGDVDPCGVVLSWMPGESATAHEVYFGTNHDDVESFDVSVYKGQVSSPLYPPDGNGLVLDYGTTYYWRIVEVSGGEQGDVWRFTTEYKLDDPSMQVWYKLDETSGNDAMDSSGYGRHADVEEGDATWVADPAFSGSVGCLEFDDDIHLDVPDEVLDGIDKEITISVWLKGSSLQSGDMVVLDVGGEFHPLKMSIVVPDSAGDVIWRAGNDTNDVLVWNDATPEGWKDDWHHFVFIKDENAKTMSIYLDAILGDSKTGAISTITYLVGKDVSVGAYTQDDSGYQGRMDDFRIYNYAFTEDDVAKLFRGGDVECAWAPNPYDGRSDVSFDTDLTWKPGDYAAEHKVFFGTSWQDVNSMTDPCATKDLGDENYDPCGLLELGKTYYWRVDEVNDACDPNTWKGKVWRFTIADYVTIDDMEDYTENYNEYPITTTQQPNYGWDSYLHNGTGALVSLQTIPPFRGHKAMYFYYDLTDNWGCGYYYAETSNHFAMDPCDWEAIGLKMLTLWFYGEPFNLTSGVEQMYVGLEDNSGGSSYSEVRYGDGEDEYINDITIAEWQEWNIPLSSFTSVDLSHMEKIYIGFGERYGSETGGAGDVYFDDIRLYQSTCVLSKRTSEFVKLDLYADCVIDFTDIEVMAEEWLRSDVNLGPVTKPDDANLLGWWMLDEGEGSTAYDSSDYGNNGTIEVIDINVSWVAGHNDVNHALDFDDGRVLVSDAAELKPMYQVSVSAWINYSEKQSSARVVVKGADNKETFDLEVDGLKLVFLVRDGNDPNAESYPKYAAESDNDALSYNEWIHIAGTYDGNMVKCYINGELAATGDASDLVFLSQDTNDLAIGNRPDAMEKPFKGLIDDVRVYDYALSAEDVRYLGTDGTGFLALQSIADLVKEPLGQGAVNLRDFAILADSWLEEEMYP